MAVGSVFPLSVALSLSEPPLIQCVAHIPSQHAITSARALEHPPGAIRKMYPFILQDTHLATTTLWRNLSEELYFHLLDLLFDWNSSVITSMKAVFLSPTCTSF